MKALLVFCVLLITSETINCGVVENVYNKVKDSIHDVKDNVHDWVKYGKAVLIGKEDENPNKLNKEGVIANSNCTESFILTAIENVRKEIRNIFKSDSNDNNESKTIIGKLYHRFKSVGKKGMTSIKNFFFESQIDLSKAAIENIEKKDSQNNTNLFADAAFNTILGNRVFKMLANKTKLEGKYKDIIKNLNNQLKHIEENTQSAYDKEKELIGTVPNKFDERVTNFKDVSKIIGTDYEKFANAVSDTVQKDYNKWEKKNK